MNVSASVLVRVSGPDARRSRGAAAGYKVHEGATAFLSCSGVLLAPPPRPAAAAHRQFVVCCGAALAPFVQAARAHLPCAHDALIAGTEVHILHEGALVHTPLVTPNASAAAWRACRLHHLDDVPHVQDAVDILTAGGAGAWRVGWSKSDDVANVRPGGGSTEDAHQRFSVAPNGVRIRASLMAILEVLPIAAADAHLPHAQLHATAAHLQRGDTLLIVSSPYGLLSPRVFQNTVSRGIVANAIAPLSHSLVSEPIAHSAHVSPDVLAHLMRLDADPTAQGAATAAVAASPALLCTDARCLPGSEGGAVYDAQHRWVGLVALPLALCDGSAVDLNLVIAADALRPWLDSHCRDAAALQPVQSSVHSLPSPKALLAPPVSRTLDTPAFVGERGVVLIRINSTWGSGIIVSRDGFVLTNAHLLKSYLVDVEQAPSLAAPPSPHATSSFATPVAAETATTMPATTNSEYAPPALQRGTSIFVRVMPFHYDVAVATAAAATVNEAVVGSFPPGAVASLPPLPPRTTSTLPQSAVAASTAAVPSLSTAPPPARWVRASLVYLSRGAWDVALLRLVWPASSLSSTSATTMPSPPQTPTPSLQQPPLFVLPRQVRAAAVGQPVLVVGFPLFAPRTGVRACVTAGVVSRIVQWQSDDSQSEHGDTDAARPVLLVTDAVVHNGNSGGALLAITRDGGGGERLELLGMVTSNVRHSRRALVAPRTDAALPVEREVSDIIPSLNFSIPIARLQPLWDYVATSDARHLHALDRTAAAIGAVWSLQDAEFAPQPPRTPPAARTLPPAALDELRRRAAL